MTTALPTRPKYAREHLTFSEAEIAELIAEGAKVFNGIVVAKVDGRTLAIRPSQVIKDVYYREARAEADGPISASQLESDALRLQEDDNAAEAELADYEAKADALGMSVEELTDGEYSRRRVDPDLLAHFTR